MRLKVIRNISACVLVLTSCFLFYLETTQAQTYSSNQLTEPGYEGRRENADGSLSVIFGYRNEN